MKIDTILKEFKILNEKSNDKYEIFLKKMLKKYGVKSPADLSTKEKKKFFDEVDRGWKAKDEKD